MLNSTRFSFDSICRHIEEDLQAQQIPTPKSVDEMSDEEKNYFFFKVHDLDGNDKLDGLEIFYSATHHSDSGSGVTDDEGHQHEHNDEQQNEIDPAIEKKNEIDNEKHESETGDSTQNSSVTNLKLLEIDGNDEGGNKNLNHIIGMLEKEAKLRINLSRSSLNIWFFSSISDVLDNFLNLADLNNDGYLNYAEYAAAVKLGNAMAHAEQHPEL